MDTAFKSCQLIALLVGLSMAGTAAAGPATGSSNVSLRIPATHNLVSTQRDSLCLNDRNGEFSFQLQSADREDASPILLDRGTQCSDGSGTRLTLRADTSSGVYYLLVAPE